jgi:RNA polymerase sigma-70 factor (ECF subfamily)
MDIESEIRRVAHDDRAAFTRLYRETGPVLIRYAMGLLAGDRDGAEDAVDEAFLAIWKQADRFDGRGNAMGWIRRIVRNKAIDWLRKQREVSASGEAALEDHSNLASKEPTPFDHAASLSHAARLREALGLLSLEQREAVWMCYYEEMPLREIAEIAGCPENTIKTRLFHARKVLRQSGLLTAAE